MYKQILLDTHLFEENDYFNKYVELININRNNSKVMFKTTAHHIIPKHCFEDMGMPINNTSINIVNLSYADHVYAHYLLAKCSIKEIHQVYNYMAMQNIAGNKYSDAKSIEEVLNSQGFKDDLNELNEKAAREAQTRIKSRAPYVRTEETKKKMSDKLSGYIHIHKGDARKMIPPEQFQLYEQQGWIKGRGITSMSEEGKKRFREKRLGHTVEEVTRQKIKEARAKQTAEKGEPAAGHKLSEQSKQQISEKLKQKVIITDGYIELHINKADLEKYMSNGFRKGRIPRAWVYKDTVNKQILLRELDVYISEGWQQGRKATKENKQ